MLRLTESLDLRPEGEKYIWIPQGLHAVSDDGQEFPAEATLSRFEMGDQHFYTLILRNVNERLLSERRIRSLTIESEGQQALREGLERVFSENNTSTDGTTLFTAEYLEVEAVKA